MQHRTASLMGIETQYVYICIYTYIQYYTIISDATSYRITEMGIEAQCVYMYIYIYIYIYIYTILHNNTCATYVCLDFRKGQKVSENFLLDDFIPFYHGRTISALFQHLLCFLRSVCLVACSCVFCIRCAVFYVECAQ